MECIPHSHRSVKVEDGALLKVGLEPWVGEDPRVLILGTLPGDESIQSRMYYANPSNRFWRIMHDIFSGNKDDKSKEFIVSHKMALWDCLKFAEREGTTDRKIVKETEIPNDIVCFLQNYPTIKTIIINGTSKTLQTFIRFFEDIYRNKKYKIIVLHQTSRNNERNNKITYETKLNEWKIVKDIVDASIQEI